MLVYAVSWLGMVILAILNGVMREKSYGRFMPELTAHQLSTFFMLVFIGAYVRLLTGLFRIESSGQALLTGGMWFVMTVAFEFVFGHYVMGHSWRRLFYDYNLLKGRVWLLVLIWVAVAPCLFYQIRS